MQIDVTPYEAQLLEILRKAKPMDLFEIAINQNGTRWRVSHITQTKSVLHLDRETRIGIV